MTDKPAAHRPADPRVGADLGKYRITGVLGRGGMGVVYEAEDRVIGRRVAIKVLPEEVSQDARALRRFLSEARAAGRLNHPNAVAVYDVARRDETVFLVMELVRGGSAADFLKARGRFNWPEATRVIADAGRALAAAHSAGLVHRDVKPANIMRSTEGTVKLADFGLAKSAGQSSAGSTGTGAVVGTPHYMSPEQAQGRPLDARSDVYSLGATYFALLTGRPPFTADNPPAILYGHCTLPPPDPRDTVPEIPPRCVEVVHRAMAKSADERYPTAAAMVSDLEAILAAPEGTQAEPPAAPEWAEFVRAVERRADATRPSTALRAVGAASARGGASRLPAAAGALVALAALSAGAWLYLSRERSGAPPPADGVVRDSGAGPAAADARAADAGVSGRRNGSVGGDKDRAAADSTAAGKTPRLTVAAFRLRAQHPARGWTVWSAAFLPDVKSLALACGDSRVRIMDVGSGEIVFDRPGHGAAVRCIAVSPAGDRMASGDMGGGLRLWNLLDRSAEPAAARPHEGIVNSLAYSDDGSRLATGGWDDRTVRIIDTGRLEDPIVVREPGPLGVTFVAFPPGGRTPLWTRGSAARPDAPRGAGVVRFFDPGTARAGRTIDVGTDHPECLAFNADGSHLAVGSWDGTVRVYEAATGRPLWTRRAAGRVFTLTYLREPAALVGAVGDPFEHGRPGEVRAWSAVDGEDVGVLWSSSAGGIAAVRAAPDGRSMAAAGFDGSVRLWQVDRP